MTPNVNRFWFETARGVSTAGFVAPRRLTIRLTILSEPLRGGMVNTTRVIVFIGVQVWQRACTCSASTMDENSNPTSAHLGVFVVMGVVPIVVYVTVVLVLPWLAKLFG